MGAAESETDLIGRIYEAAVVSDTWPEILDAIAVRAGAKGAMYMARSPTEVHWLASPALQGHILDYVAAGWMNDTAHAGPLLAEQYPGFRTETDFRTAEEIARLPVHAEFLDPRGLIAGAGTVFQGAADDALHFTLEGFDSHDAARAALPALDAIRPHLGRAISLTAHARRERERTIVEALQLAGAGAAVVASDGVLRTANARFVRRLGDGMDEIFGRLRFADRFLDIGFRDALASQTGGARETRSIPVAGRDGAAPFVVHVLPLSRTARDRADSDGLLLLLAESANASIPDADLLRLLFDLTPAEARVARRIVQGATPADIARTGKVSEATVRVQLKAVFAKTGVTRQVDLLRLLTGLGAPTGR